MISIALSSSALATHLHTPLQQEINSLQPPSLDSKLGDAGCYLNMSLLGLTCTKTHRVAYQNILIMSTAVLKKHCC